MPTHKEKTEGTILSGMRPTGRLHIGHLSVLENWAALQENYRCFFMIADWHALTTAYDDTEKIPENIQRVAAGLAGSRLGSGKSHDFCSVPCKSPCRVDPFAGNEYAPFLA